MFSTITLLHITYYSYNNVKWLDSIGELDKSNYKFFLKTGQQLFDIVKIIEFSDSYTSYIRVFLKMVVLRVTKSAIWILKEYGCLSKGQKSN